MTIDELKQSLTDIYNEAIKQHYETVKYVTKVDVYASIMHANIVYVDLWRDENFADCYAFGLKDGKPYCVDDGMFVDFSSIEAFFMEDKKEDAANNDDTTNSDDDSYDEKPDPNLSAISFFKQHFYVQTDDQIEPEDVAHHWLICKDAPHVCAVVVINKQEFDTLSGVLETRHGKLHATNGKIDYDSRIE